MPSRPRMALVPCNHRKWVLLLAAAWASGCSGAPTGADAFGANIPLHPITGEPAAISFHLEPDRRAEEPEPERMPLVAAIWSDGWVTWSADRGGGGSPYFAARMTMTGVAELVAQLRARIEECPVAGRSYTIPDAAHQELTLLDGGRFSGLASCIDLFETHPNVVATDNGIEALEGRDRSTILAAQSRAHRELRRIWKECVDSVLAAIPTEGEPSMHSSFDYVHWDSRRGRQRAIPR